MLLLEYQRCTIYKEVRKKRIQNKIKVCYAYTRCIRIYLCVVTATVLGGKGGHQPSNRLRRSSQVVKRCVVVWVKNRSRGLFGRVHCSRESCDVAGDDTHHIKLCAKPYNKVWRVQTRRHRNLSTVVIITTIIIKWNRFRDVVLNKPVPVADNRF